MAGIRQTGQDGQAQGCIHHGAFGSQTAMAHHQCGHNGEALAHQDESAQSEEIRQIWIL